MVSSNVLFQLWSGLDRIKTYVEEMKGGHYVLAGPQWLRSQMREDLTGFVINMLVSGQ